MYLSNGTDGDETIYITSEDGFYKLSGYSIYYERNQMMQDYMVLRKDIKRIETDTNDKVIEEFRKRMDDHKEEATDRHQTTGLLRGMCMAMSIVVLAGGIVLFNNYEQMRDMESVIVSAIPEKAEKILIGQKKEKQESQGKTGVLIEEAEGEVSPTTAVNKETMSETIPQADNTIQSETEAAGESTSDTTQAAKSEEQVTKSPQETAKETEAAAVGDPKVYVVEEGETLFGICIKEYQNAKKLKEICELNGLEDENKIIAGQKLILP